MVRMHVLGADYGDCLWVEYGEPASPRRVLIDAGTPATFNRLRPLMESVRGEVPSHELLVITHIDEDHIGGALKLLADSEMAAQFKHVWFNGRRHLLEAAKEEDFGAVQGEELTALLLKRMLPWNVHFGGLAVARAANGAPARVELPGGATLTVLTPSQIQLKRLLPVWDKAVRDAGLDPATPAPNPSGVPGEESFGLLDVLSLAASQTSEDSAEANGSSISVLFEYEGKRLLLAADAHPSGLLEGIRNLTGGERLKVDVFKLPHHGSKSNVTSALLDLVEAEHVVFSSNGVRFRHPDPEAVARVIKRFAGSASVTLIFNYETPFTTVWRDPSLQRRWGYKTCFGAGNEGVTLVLS